jgi:hypothetical protein
LIRQLDNRFFFAFPADHDCKTSSCYIRLLDAKDGQMNERFSFSGTGVILLFSDGALIEHFQDRFFKIGLET